MVWNFCLASSLKIQTTLHIQKHWNYSLSSCFIQRHQKARTSFCTGSSQGALVHAAALTVTYPSDASLRGSPVLQQRRGQWQSRQHVSLHNKRPRGLKHPLTQVTICVQREERGTREFHHLQAGRSPRYRPCPDGWAGAPPAAAGRESALSRSPSLTPRAPVLCPGQMIPNMLVLYNTTFCLQSRLEKQSKLCTATCHVA